LKLAVLDARPRGVGAGLDDLRERNLAPIELDAPRFDARKFQQIVGQPR